MKACGIYMVLNSVNLRSYIGMSIDIQSRWEDHVSPRSLRRNHTLAKAFRKYGIEAFMFCVLEECQETDLAERERYWISKWSPEYNMTEGGDGQWGRLLSEKSRQQIAEKLRIRWNLKTPEQKAQFIRHNLRGPRKGHSVSLETREKLRLANIGKRLSEEHRLKISIGNKLARQNNNHTLN